MSSFFTLPRKRKREDGTATSVAKKRGAARGSGHGPDQEKQKIDRDESISGSDVEDEEESASGESSADEGASVSGDEDETGADRRLRLAERYLENIREEVDEVGFDAAEIDRDLIAERLKEDVDEAKGRLFRQISAELSFSAASHSPFRADTQSTTAVAIHNPWVYTVSKDKTLIKWELAPPTQNSVQHDTPGARPARPQRKKPKKVKSVRGIVKSAEGGKLGHVGSILTVAVSPSGHFLATGGTDRRLVIWDAENLEPLKVFTQHRDTVCSVSFTGHISPAASGEQLFSASFDRTIKTWSLSSGGHAYVETLFGHQDHVLSVASMATDQCVSSGARDRTARLWKVVDETQLVFRGGSSKSAQYAENSIDCVAVIPPTHFVTGSDSGDISLWSVHKKKPLHTIHQAHGLDPLPSLDELYPELDQDTSIRNSRHLRRTPRWITALTSLPGTDIVLSGSWDGWIRVWKVSEDKRRIESLGAVGDNDSLLPAADNSTDPIPPGMNGDSANGTSADSEGSTPKLIMEPPLNGIVNGIAAFERRSVDTNKKSSKSKSKSTDTEPTRGLCIVAAVGKEHRLGRWKVFNSTDKQNNGGKSGGGKNGAVVFEVPWSSDSAQGPGDLPNGAS